MSPSSCPFCEPDAGQTVPHLHVHRRVRHHLGTVGTAVLALLASACGEEPAVESPDASGPGEAVPAPSEPLFEIAISPGEGIPVFEAVGVELPLRHEPHPTAQVARRVALAEGTELTFDHVRYQTWLPGLLEVRDTLSIEGRDLGQPRLLEQNDYYRGDFARREWSLLPGDTLEFLQHRAEGSCFVRLGASVIDARSCPVFDEERVRRLSEADTRWWIRLVLDEVPAGWLEVRDDQVRLVDRRF